MNQKKKWALNIIFSIFFISMASASTPGNISSCQTLNISGVYILNQSINATSTCFTISVGNVTLNGDGYTLGGDRDATDYGVSVTSGSNITVMNISINNFGVGVYFSSVDYSLVTETRIFNSSQYGCQIISSNFIILNNNTVNYSVDNGFRITSSANNTITNNTLTYNGNSGIFFSGNIYNNITKNNVSYNSNQGIDISASSSYNNMLDNEVGNNSQNGIYIRTLSFYNIIENNTANKNIGSGIRLDVGNNSVIGNNISSNLNGLYLSSSGNNTLKQNRVFINTNYGIYLEGVSTSNNSIYNNLFNNTNNYFFSSAGNNSWNITLTLGTNIFSGPYIGGNFWTNSTVLGFSQSATLCQDSSPNDGICDSNYTIRRGDIDYFPLTIFNDTTPPSITLSSPQNITYNSTNNITINFSASDLSSISKQWYYNGSANISYTGVTSVVLLNGNFTFIFYANDTAGKINYTSVNFTVSFSSDNTPPIITINTPQNITYTTITIIFNVSLNENASWCGFSLDGAANVSMTANSFNTGFGYINSTMSQGSHSVRFSCNDTTGNMNYSGSVSFIISVPSASSGNGGGSSYIPPVKEEEICGNKKCAGIENARNCPDDCPQVVVCGDSICSRGEISNCYRDCVKCGDGICNGNETTKNCLVDCKHECVNPVGEIGDYSCVNGIIKKCESENGWIYTHKCKTNICEKSSLKRETTATLVLGEITAKLCQKSSCFQPYGVSGQYYCGVKYDSFLGFIEEKYKRYSLFKCEINDEVILKSPSTKLNGWTQIENCSGGCLASNTASNSPNVCNKTEIVHDCDNPYGKKEQYYCNFGTIYICSIQNGNYFWRQFKECLGACNITSVVSDKSNLCNNNSLPQPDLFIKEAKLIPQSSNSKNKSNLVVVIENKGFDTNKKSFISVEVKNGGMFGGALSSVDSQSEEIPFMIKKNSSYKTDITIKELPEGYYVAYIIVSNKDDKNTDDNKKQVYFSVAENKPDLLIKNIKLIPEKINIAQTPTFITTIENIGFATATPSFLEIEVKNGGMFGWILPSIDSQKINLQDIINKNSSFEISIKIKKLLNKDYTAHFNVFNEKDQNKGNNKKSVYFSVYGFCEDKKCEGDENELNCISDCPSVCGNNLCAITENIISCSKDCPVKCGDKICSPSENSSTCKLDCNSICGNKICEADENFIDCPKDCTLKCGDGICSIEAGEPKNCTADCPVCGNKICEKTENPTNCLEDCCGGCGDGKCTGYACGENPYNCAVDCGTACGNGVCDKGENPENCIYDCKVEACGNGICEASDGGAKLCSVDCGTACGNGVCVNGESYTSCPIDCGFCGDGICSEKDLEENCTNDCNPVCGDSICTLADKYNCPEDCSSCGDGICEGKENMIVCPSDCVKCGDGVCFVSDEFMETYSDCPDDCGPICGNLKCEDGENPFNCPTDCYFSKIIEKKQNKSKTEAVVENIQKLYDSNISSYDEDTNKSETLSAPMFGSYCGDGFCGKTETFLDCSNDCKAQCGDNYCGSGESSMSCSYDCYNKNCGNDICEFGESPTSCLKDCCGICGDGFCKGYSCGENPNTCAQDCGTACGDGVCDKGENPLICSEDCGKSECGDGQCTFLDGGPVSCPIDCGTACGDGACVKGESYILCPVDCGFCGDDFCTAEEIKFGCVFDCEIEGSQPDYAVYKYEFKPNIIYENSIGANFIATVRNIGGDEKVKSVLLYIEFINKSQPTSFISVKSKQILPLAKNATFTFTVPVPPLIKGKYVVISEIMIEDWAKKKLKDSNLKNNILKVNFTVLQKSV